MRRRDAARVLYQKRITAGAEQNSSDWIRLDDPADGVPGISFKSADFCCPLFQNLLGEGVGGELGGSCDGFLLVRRR